MVSNVKNENLLKLRALTDKMCYTEATDNIYKTVIDEIKSIIETEKENMQKERSSIRKVKCYEEMCSKIKVILNKLKNI